MSKKSSHYAGVPRTSYSKCYPQPNPVLANHFSSSPNGPSECRPKPGHRDDCERCVNIWTHIDVNQSNTAQANGGAGGSGGSACSMPTVAVNSGEDGCAIASHTHQEPHDPGPNGVKTGEVSEAGAPEAEDVEALQDIGNFNVNSPSAGGSGGAGGAGGSNTADQSNSSAIAVENVIVLCCGEGVSAPGMALGLNGRKLDIKVDEKGATWVNGEKMEEKDLGSGTKVLIVRNIDSKETKSEA